MSVVILETDRLLLRQLEWEDLDALAAIMADPLVMRYIGQGKPKTRSQVERAMGFWINDGRRAWDETTLAKLPQLRRAIGRDAHLSLWAAIHKPDKKLIGRCGLLSWDLDGRKEVEVGYLISRGYWGKGLGTEVAGGIRDYGFNQLGFNRLVSLIQPANVASIRVAEKVGMTLEREVDVRGVVALLYVIARPGAGG